jgi:hypothetical protein
MKKYIVRGLLLFVYCVPYAFLSVMGDAAAGTLFFYGVMIVSFSLLCWGALKSNNVAILYIGNVLSMVSSLLIAKLNGMEPMGYYFKPFTSYSLMLVISVAALIIQVVIERSAAARKAEE